MFFISIQASTVNKKRSDFHRFFFTLFYLFKFHRETTISILLLILYGIGWLIGIVFAFILLTSFTGFKNGEIPMTFILVTIIFIGQQIFDGLTVKDNISNISHIVGGMVGAFAGYNLNKK